MNKLTGRLNSDAKIEVEISSTGPKGTDGLSAYEIWLELGNIGTMEDFIREMNDYHKTINKPSINGMVLEGNLELEGVSELGVISEEDILEIFEEVSQ